MGFWKGLSIGFVSFILILLITLITISFSLNQFLYPSVYLESLEESGSYDAVFSLLFPSQKNSTERPQDFSIIEETFENLLSKILEYLRGEKENLDLNLTISSEELETSLEKNYPNLPLCEKSKDPLSPEEGLCRPPQIQTYEEFKLALEERGINLTEKINYDLGKNFEGSEKISTIKDSINTYKKVVYAACLLSLILIALIIFIARNNLLALKVIGLDLFVSGIVLLILGLSGKEIYLRFFEEGKVHEQFILSLANNLGESLLIGGIILGLTGVILFLISLFLKKKSK